MVRKLTVLTITALAVAGIASSASAEIVSGSYGTGNWPAYHYDSNGKLVPGMMVLDDRTAAWQWHPGHSAYAKVPRKVPHKRK